MTLTRQHFNLIASTIRDCDIYPEHRRLMAEDMARALNATNSNFDRDRFLAACDPSQS
jgi:hypothetical protein